MKKIQKAEYKISKHQKRITSGLSTWVKHVILCLAFQVQFTWTVTGNRVWRCSDYFLFLGCYLVLRALGWLQLFLSGRYYIQIVMKCELTGAGENAETWRVGLLFLRDQGSRTLMMDISVTSSRELWLCSLWPLACLPCSSFSWRRFQVTLPMCAGETEE